MQVLVGAAMILRADADDSSRRPPVRWVPGVDFGGGAEFPLSAARPLAGSTRRLGRLPGSPDRRLGRRSWLWTRRSRRSRASPPSTARRPAASLASDLITLTKPRIISLLLLTTVLPMFITDRGLPPSSLVLWVLLGGYLMAGGANTVNMWFDRDIDMLMSRTKLRPDPLGTDPRLAALLLRAGAGSGGVLALLAIRQSAQRLAGAQRVPVLRLHLHRLAQAADPAEHRDRRRGRRLPAAGGLGGDDRLARPRRRSTSSPSSSSGPRPHFWALALIKRQDYAKAGIPMMPVVQGERWTKIQMLAYTLMLIPLTADADGVRGAGAVLRRGRARCWAGGCCGTACGCCGRPSVTPTAWKMYKYSLLYLALLFVAMGVDRALPFGHGFERAPVLILEQPER